MIWTILWVHIQNLRCGVYSWRHKSNQHDLSWEMIPDFSPSSLWQAWCAARKSHFHKCFIPFPPGTVSLEHELWPAWPTSIFPGAHPFSFAVTVAPPAEMTRWKELVCLLTNPLPESLPGGVFMFFSQSQHDPGFLSLLLGGQHREIPLWPTSIPTYNSHCKHYLRHAIFEQ